MRRFNRPASGSASGSTLNANVPLPVGASHSSHSRPSTIRPSRLPTATARVPSTALHRNMAGIISSMTVPDLLKAGWRERIALLAETLQTWPWLDTLKTLRQRFREDRLGLTASPMYSALI
eukprot:Opistho-2@7431